MSVVAVIQARTGSTRLPDKVLRQLPYGGGITVLQQVIARLQKASRLDAVTVATTDQPADDAIVDLAARAGAGCHRGSVRDVLARCYGAAAGQQADIVVRITGDCPCIDPAVVDAVIEKHIAEGNDFTSNILTRTFPHGMDTEVMSFSAMRRAHKEATLPYDREHVCPFIYRTRPDAFRIGQLHAAEAQSGPHIRVTLDTPQDYTLICAVFDQLYDRSPVFGVEEIVSLFNRKGWLAEINASVVQKAPPTTAREEIARAVHLLDLQELHRARDILKGHLDERLDTD